jgi:hypothetical protein
MRILKIAVAGGFAIAGLILGSLPVRAEGGELAVYGGGIHIGDGGGNHATVGGDAGFNAGAHLQIFGEANYSPLGSYGSVSSKLLNAGGGARIRFAEAEAEAKVIPYVSLLGGVGRTSVSGMGSSASSSSAYAGAGFGANLKAGAHWGVRPEVRYQRYMQHGGGNALLFMGGLFYQFGK